ncbi:hypothetical protein ACFL59_02690 [Planctomycetota bacterium]
MKSHLDQALGMSGDEQVEAYKKREEDREAAQEKKQEASDGETAANEITKVLKGVAGILDNVVKTYKAWNAAFPDDLAGTWRVEGGPEESVTWLLELKKAGEKKYKGVLSARSYRGGDTLAPTVEEKAKVTLKATYDPNRYDVAFEGTRKRWSEIEVSTSGSRTLAGGLSGSGVIAFDSSRHAHAEGLALLGRTRNLHFERPNGFGVYLSVLTAAFKTLASIPAALPTRTEKRLKLYLMQKIDIPLARLKAWSSKLPGASFFKNYVQFDVSGGQILLGFKAKAGRGNLGIGARWDLERIIDYALDDDPAPENLPWIPVSVQGQMKVPKIPVAFTVEWAKLDPEKDKNAGKQGIEDSLDGVLDFKEAFDDYLKDMGCRYDVLMPEIKGGDLVAAELPALEIPVVLYVDEFVYDQDTNASIKLNSKITFKLALSSKAVLQLFPQLRALMFAWDCGWAIGTFIRERLQSYEAYRKFEQDCVDAIGEVVYNTGYHKRWSEIDKAIRDIRKDNAITMAERTLAKYKAPCYVWWEMRKEDEDDNPPDWPMTVIDHARDGFMRQLEYIKKRKPVGSRRYVIPTDKRDYPNPRNVNYIETYAEALVYLYLFGENGIGRKKAKQAVEEAIARNEIKETRARLLNLYLDYRAENWDIHKLIAWRTESGKLFRKAIADPSCSELEKREWQTFDKLVRNGWFSEFVKSVTAPWPDPDWKDHFYVTTDSDDKFWWCVTRKMANRHYKIKFYETDYSDDCLFVVYTDSYSRRWLNQQHRYWGDFEDTFFKVQLKRFRNSKNDRTFYVCIYDAKTEKKVYTSSTWTLWIGDEGQVKGYKRPNSSKWNFE